MKIRTRDFIEHRYNAKTSKFDYFLNGKPLALSEGENTDYVQRIVTTDPAVDLHHGPALVVCMGVMQTDDVSHRSTEEVRADLESGRTPYLKKFLDQLARGNEIEPVLKHLGEGLDRMSRGYFRMVDEIFGDPSMQMPPPATYLVSYSSIENRMKSIYDFAQADQSAFVTPEAVEFVRRTVAPYLGEKCITHTAANGSETLEVRNPKPTKEIIGALQNLILLGNSTGANFIIEIENVLQKTLEQSQFSKTDVKAIMRSVHALGVGQLANYEKLSGPRFTSVYFEGMNDLVSESLNPYKIEISQQEINRYCKPSQLALLNGVAQQHYRAVRAMVDNKAAKMDAAELPLTGKQVFIPRPQSDDNRMLVLATLPMDRVKWATRSFLKPTRYHASPKAGMPVSDPQTEKQFHEMLEAIATDKNGHNIAYFITQGYPPFYLVALVQRIIKNMVALPSLTEAEKREFTAQDLMLKNLTRYNVGQDAHFVGQQDILQDAVRNGLNIAAKQPSGQYACR